MRRDGLLLGAAALAAVGIAIALLYGRGERPSRAGAGGVPSLRATIVPDVSGGLSITPPSSASTPPAGTAVPSPGPTAAPEIHVAVYDRPVPTEVPAVRTPGPGDNVEAPVLVSRVETIYPVAARRARMEGSVVIQAVITEEGEVRDPRVVRSANPLLDGAALAAVRQWKYRAATFEGRPVRTFVTVMITFSLN